MTYIFRSLQLGLGLILLQAANVANADWIDFQNGDLTVGEGAGIVPILLTRTAPTADSVFAYLSVENLTTSAADYDASPGSLDADFNTPKFDLLSGAGAGNGAGEVLWVDEYADGRLLVGGYWDEVNGAAAPCVVRLLPDGTPDASFIVNLPNNACPAFDGRVLADDKAYLTWGFTDPQGNIQIFLVRLNEDGSVDQSFTQVTPGPEHREGPTHKTSGASPIKKAAT